MPQLSRRQWLSLAAAQAGVWSSTGCGTILHPERRGQAAGPLDWKIVALDGIGLLLFFVPGVIAFAVDFSNGSIYLPEGSYSDKGSSPRKSLIMRQLPSDSPTMAEVEQVVAEHTGETINLTPGTYRSERIAQLDEFWPTVEALAEI